MRESQRFCESKSTDRMCQRTGRSTINPVKVAVSDNGVECEEKMTS